MEFRRSRQRRNPTATDSDFPPRTPSGSSPYAARLFAVRGTAVRRTRHGRSPYAARLFAVRGTAVRRTRHGCSPYAARLFAARQRRLFAAAKTAIRRTALPHRLTSLHLQPHDTPPPRSPAPRPRRPGLRPPRRRRYRRRSLVPPGPQRHHHARRLGHRARAWPHRRRRRVRSHVRTGRGRLQSRRDELPQRDGAPGRGRRGERDLPRPAHEAVRESRQHEGAVRDEPALAQVAHGRLGRWAQLLPRDASGR